MKAGRSFLWGAMSFLLLWWGISLLADNRSLPDPYQTFQRFWQLRAELGLHAGASMIRVLISLFFALLIGIPLGIFLGRTKIAAIVDPLLYFLYPIPKVAFLPVFMIFFGLGNVSKVILIFSVIVIQVVVSIRDGVKEIPATYFQVMQNYTQNPLHQIRFLILPAIMPALFASMRVSIGISLASLFFAENYNTTYGVGYLILSAWSKMDYEQMLSGIVVIALMGFFFFGVVDGLENRVCRYRS
ncbi:ABC transporter permease [Enterococcus gallinarum]|uniref:ABC transporter permease n=1 Tax=Enterococcus gallinarum TaxID=1353 RepID=A0ABD4ZYC1_ENTGA|nr:ABC transporter permease [Enterococcus gallinarum]MBF0824427.1 ABC transporter permease [Enterococcus faecalis]MBF0725448.1 ABC transporter permease [Enterococcus gallinarum]MBF0798291.1 ABC transporter permease [Enterococcus gallinarum]MBX8978944.1 ABC transporter permease [Enterococcus gallinarum]MCO5475512.1 ABC transporter permease [Enterococcus gallinarum]